MNTIKKNNKIYKFEFFLRDKENPLGTIKDYNNNYFQWPKEGKLWDKNNIFLKKLVYFQKIKKKIKHKKKNIQNCILCDKKNINDNYYISNDILWEDSLYHYIKEHKIKPSNEFIDYISKNTIDIKNDSNTNIVGKMNSKIYKRNKKNI